MELEFYNDQAERTQKMNEVRLQEGRQKTKQAHSDFEADNANSTYQKEADNQLHLFMQEMLRESHNPLEEPTQDLELPYMDHEEIE